jgi:hypothetical protein
LPSPRTPPVPSEEHFEQIANPSLLRLLREGMSQWQLGLHPVDVSPTNALASDVAVLDELGDDPVGASLRHPDGLGDVAQANAGVVRDAQQDLSVVREELVLGHLLAPRQV